jgi:hypothetical protein
MKCLIVDSIILTESSLGIFPSGLNTCRFWRHWGAGWISFTLAILGFVRGSPNILPDKVPSEFMGVANTYERPGERHSQQFSAKEGFV